MAQVQEPQMTFEQIEAHIKKANLDQYDKPKPKAAAAAGAQHALTDQLQKICGVYKGIRPILQAVVHFPLVPSSIKKALKTFMKVMDSICP